MWYWEGLNSQTGALTTDLTASTTVLSSHSPVLTIVSTGWQHPELAWVGTSLCLVILVGTYLFLVDTSTGPITGTSVWELEAPIEEILASPLVTIRDLK